MTARPTSTPRSCCAGHPVVCVRVDSPLAALEEVSVADLLSEPLIVMRAGYLMYRFVHRLLDGHVPTVSYSTDGGEMGKLMVAEGLGSTVLPDFSVIHDPLAREGVITWRRLTDNRLRFSSRSAVANRLPIPGRHATCTGCSCSAPKRSRPS